MSIIIHQVTNTSRDNANGQVTALTDRRWYDFLIQQTGIVTGCEVSALSGLQMQVQGGWGIIQGSLFTIGTETITATPSTSGTVNGRLLLQIDTATAQGSFITQASATLPALVQENINTNGTIYQLPLATYQVSELAVSGLINVAPSITSLMAMISALQTAVAGKQPTVTGGATSITSNDLTANRALVSDANGKVGVSATTATQLGYVNGVTSAIQTQLDGKVPTSRTVNSKALTGNISLGASDVGAVPTSRTVNGHALSGNVSVTKSDVGLGNVDNSKQMPIAGGTFTGVAYAQSANGNQTRLRNIVVQNSGGTAQSTNYIIMRRK